MWEEVLLFFFPFRSQILWRVFDIFLDLVILVSFNAISIDFYSVKSFLDLVILVSFNAISIDFYSVKSFICLYFV